MRMIALALLLTIWLVTGAWAQGTLAAPASDRPIPQRRVSLKADAISRREALDQLCQQAGARLEWDTAALAATSLRPEDEIRVSIDGERLADAFGQIIDWSQHQGVFYEVRGNTVRFSTLAAKRAWDRQHTPEWLQGRSGFLINVNPDGEVDSVHAGKDVTDELLTKIAGLPQLKKLDLSEATLLTREGLAVLRDCPSLESLTLSGTDGLGDAAIQALRGHASLKFLEIRECGTTDAGIHQLTEFPQLQRLFLYQEGRLTDAAIASLARLKRLTSLNLTSYVTTQNYGKMKFSESALSQLSALTELEHLILPGHDFPLDALPFPNLQSVTLSGPRVDDAIASKIAECRKLRHLSFEGTRLGNDGLKVLTDLSQLETLYIRDGNVTDSGLQHLETLKQLRHISLYRLFITNEGVAHLGKIPSLTRIDLSGGSYNAAGLSQLKGLPRLKTLWLTGVQDPAGFRELRALAGLRELTFEMCPINQEQFGALEQALPQTRITAGNGAGFLRSTRIDRNGF